MTADVPDPRTDPPAGGSEAEVLLGFLEFHRTIFRMKTAGLTAAQRDQRLAPSGITLGGMAKHLAYVEDWWTTQVFAGRDAPEPWASADWDADPDWDWHSAADDGPAAVEALLDAAVARSRQVVADALAGPDGLDAPAARPGRLEGLRLRWIVVHLVEEYCRHNGHADLVRESIDGQVGE
ncbi:DinB family protein [Nocardioides scoriae]|uniref:DinB family protein n=1 Tax=Nocardioides scoriae TaxID=642780 RepID=UPI000B89B756|nr:DinB family protein [Nocardioides scoriae]